MRNSGNTKWFREFIHFEMRAKKNCARSRAPVGLIITKPQCKEAATPNCMLKCVCGCVETRPVQSSPDTTRPLQPPPLLAVADQRRSRTPRIDIDSTDHELGTTNCLPEQLNYCFVNWISSRVTTNFIFFFNFCLKL